MEYVKEYLKKLGEPNEEIIKSNKTLILEH